MTIQQISAAIKPQFILEKEPFKRLRYKSIDKEEKYKGFAPMVFIGIATAFNIPRKDIIDHLGMKNQEYETKLYKFNKFMALIKSKKEAGTLLESTGREHRVYLKTKLTLNYIKNNFPTEISKCNLDL